MTTKPPLKRDLINSAAKESGVFQYDAHPAINAFLDEIIIHLKDHNRLEVRDFGVFYIVERKNRKVRDFKLGTHVPMGKSREIRFKPSRLAKKAVNMGVRDD